MVQYLWRLLGRLIGAQSVNLPPPPNLHLCQVYDMFTVICIIVIFWWGAGPCWEILTIGSWRKAMRSPWKMCRVQYQEDVLVIIHSNPSTSTCQIQNASTWESIVPFQRTTSIRVAPLGYCAIYCRPLRQYLQEMCVHSIQRVCMGNGESSCCSLLPIKCQCLGQNHRLLCIQTICDIDFLSGVHYSDFLEETLPLL